MGSFATWLLKVRVDVRVAQVVVSSTSCWRPPPTPMCLPSRRGEYAVLGAYGGVVQT